MIDQADLQFLEGDGLAKAEYARSLAELMPPSPSRIFDMGGGSGFVVREIATATSLKNESIVLLDRDVRCIGRATANLPGAAVVVGDVERMPFMQREAGEVVLYSHSLYEVRDPWRAVVDQMGEAQALVAIRTSESASSILRRIGMQERGQDFTPGLHAEGFLEVCDSRVWHVTEVRSTHILNLPSRPEYWTTPDLAVVRYFTKLSSDEIRSSERVVDEVAGSFAVSGSRARLEFVDLVVSVASSAWVPATASGGLGPKDPR